MDKKITFSDFVLVIVFFGLLFFLGSAIYSQLNEFDVSRCDIYSFGVVDEKAVFVQYLNDEVILCIKSYGLGGREDTSLEYFDTNIVAVHQVLDSDCTSYCLIRKNEFMTESVDIYIPKDSEVLKDAE